MVAVKICGLTRAADAAFAAASGADYLGVVFAGGPRLVSAAAATEIVGAAGGVPVFGVFSEQTEDEILRLRDRAGLGGAQLHGRYPAAAAGRLRSAGLAVWRVARIAASGGSAELAAAADQADAVLIEPLTPLPGGAGVPLAAEQVRAARRLLAGHRLVLAGGLRPETVGAAVTLGPDVVDVSSGVESAPGAKDPRLIARFLEAVRGSSARV